MVQVWDTRARLWRGGGVANSDKLGPMGACESPHVSDESFETLKHNFTWYQDLFHNTRSFRVECIIIVYMFVF